MREPTLTREAITNWYATAADKLLFQTLLAGDGFPVPELLAATAPGRRVPGEQVLRNTTEIAGLSGHPSNYPLFAKPIDGKYSISVVSADAFAAAPRAYQLALPTICPAVNNQGRTCWVLTRCEPVHQVGAGDVAWTPPGARHWPGAICARAMILVAVAGSEAESAARSFEPVIEAE